MRNKTNERLKNYDNKGVIIERNLISQEDVERIIKELNTFYLNNKNSLEEGKEVNFADSDKTIINSLHRLEK